MKLTDSSFHTTEEEGERGRGEHGVGGGGGRDRRGEPQRPRRQRRNPLCGFCRIIVTPFGRLCPIGGFVSGEGGRGAAGQVNVSLWSWALAVVKSKNHSAWCLPQRRSILKARRSECVSKKPWLAAGAEPDASSSLLPVCTASLALLWYLLYLP